MLILSNSKGTVVQIPPMRPSFVIEFPIEPTMAIDRLSVLMNDKDHPIEGRIAGNHLMLVIPPKHRHFWSPWLNIEVQPCEQGASIKGRFSPNPSVWTGYMLGYIALATLLFFALIFGFSQWITNKPPTALQLGVIPVAIAIIMYWISLVGQKLAQEQMNELYTASMIALSGEAGHDHARNTTAAQAV